MAKLIKFLFNNKKTCLLACGLILFFSLLPTQFTNAETQYEFCPGGCSWTHIGNCFTCLATWISSLPLRFALFLLILPLFLTMFGSGLIYYLVATIASYLIKVSLIVPVSPSSPNMGSDFIVSQAWRFTRDFADMFLIIMLAFIGLATVLRIKDYEAKKLLPTLIVIAILINFTPVIIGFVVDIGNIGAHFFTTKAMSYMGNAGLASAWHWFTNSSRDIWMSDGHFWERLFAVKSFTGQAADCYGNYFMMFIGIFVTGTVLVAFYLYSAYVYLLLAWIFFYRIIALWIVMILSPIMFVFRIFPYTKKYYSEWLKEGLQWAIIGIPIGFFLLLSNWIMATTANDNNAVTDLFKVDTMKSEVTTQEDTFGTMMKDNGKDEEQSTQQSGQQQNVCSASSGPLSGMDKNFASLFASLLGPMLALVVLHVGIKKSKSGMPKAAQGIMDYGDKAVKMAKTVAMAAIPGGAAVAGLKAGSLALAGKAVGGGGRVFSSVISGAEKGSGLIFKGASKTASIPTGWASKYGLAPKGAKGAIENIAKNAGEIPFKPGAAASRTIIQGRSSALGEFLKGKAKNVMSSSIDTAAKQNVTDKQWEAYVKNSVGKGGAAEAIAWGAVDKGGKTKLAEKKGWFGRSKDKAQNAEETADSRIRAATYLDKNGLQDFGKSSFSAEYIQRTALDDSGKQKFSEENVKKYREGKEKRDAGQEKKARGEETVERDFNAKHGTEWNSINDDIGNLEERKKTGKLDQSEETTLSQRHLRRDELKNEKENMRNANAEVQEGKDGIREGETTWGAKGKELDDAVTEKFKKAKPEEIAKANESELKNVTRNAVRVFDGAKFSAIINNFSKDLTDALQNELDNIPFKELLRINPKGAMWLMTNALQEGGFTPPRDTPIDDKKELKKIVDEIRELRKQNARKTP